MSWHFVNDRPIYAQIVEQIQLKILSGEYKPGQRLTSIREMAAEAAVNPNTMQRAFSELEQSGLVCAKRTSGRFISEDEKKIAEVRHQYARKSVLEFIDQMNGLGYSSSQMINLMSAIIEEEIK